MCNNCTFCHAGQGLSFGRRMQTATDAARMSQVLTTIATRDDPRLLARFAFGIASPRLTALKCSTAHKHFGCMNDVDFNVLLKEFDKECAAVDYVIVEVEADALKSKTTKVIVKKRPLAEAPKNQDAAVKRGRYGR